MLRIHALGGLSVSRDGAPAAGAAARRKPLALLALLAAAGERGVSRDKLLAYLWPECEPEKASHRLTQLLYALRRDLKADALFLGSSDLRLNPDIISADVTDFTDALK